MTEDLTAEYGELIEQAREVARLAYVPDSGFHVGAAILAGSGEVYTGCNVENASYGVSICAERTALFTAVAAGERDFVALAVVAEDGTHDAPPCGACRQALIEYSPGMTVVYRYGGRFVVRTADELLPDPFIHKEDEGE